MTMQKILFLGHPQILPMTLDQVPLQIQPPAPRLTPPSPHLDLLPILTLLPILHLQSPRNTPGLFLWSRKRRLQLHQPLLKAARCVKWS